ncbi:hypothetical protein M426DRAFT_325579 [Hypoxylon sp. CI-4A]|nr:hypothetical protein M426DRAFT_325579 [Hypoxylon sp. CI-4A]
MKGSRSACLLCRHIAATSGRLRSAQPQVQVARFSTTTASRSDDPNAATISQASNDESIAIEATADKKEINRVRRVLNDRQQNNTSNIRWSQKKSRKAPAKDSARVDALFQQIVTQQGAIKDATTDAAPNIANQDLALVQAIGKLEHMLEKGEPELDAYTYLKTEIYPMLQEPDVTIPRVFYRVVLNLMEGVITTKKAAMRDPKLPTVAEILRVYVDIGEMKPSRWAMLVGELTKSIVELDSSTEQQKLSEADEDLITPDEMLADLVECWKVFSLQKVVPISPDNEVTDISWFPRLNKVSLKKFSDKGNFPAAFSSIFPQYPPKQLGAPVAVLAIATYALVLDPLRSNPDVRRSATSFIAKVGYLITFVNFRDAALREEVSNHFPALKGYIMDQWPIIKKQLKDKIESMTTSTAQPGEALPSASSSDINAVSLQNRLGRAHMARNMKDVDELWRKFVGSDKEIPPERATALREHPGLFDSFVHTRMAFNQPDRAIDILNTLRKIGLRPTLRTWNVMLDGCKNARNINAIKNVWAKIAGSGMKLDVGIWTTRISGLIESGDATGGIQALQEMTSLWNKSSKDENTKAVKPTIEPVNAALAGLIRLGQVAAANSLLAWSDQQGIEPDIFTFNTLLRQFIRDQREDDVRRIFNIMEKTGVRADEVTFTIILDAAFSKIPPDDAEAQAKAVAGVLDDMKKVGLKANMHTYGKMVYNLLRMGDRAREAVKAVLGHLWSKGHELSPHIYTMLVEHYFFARKPPDLDAVELLLQRRPPLDYDDMDSTFYDRVIKGYSFVGQPDKALEMYYRLTDAGVVIPSPQTELLRALLKQDRMEDARGLVENTKKMFEESYRAADSVENKEFWGHLFWRLAYQHGLFEMNDTPPTGGHKPS